MNFTIEKVTYHEPKSAHEIVLYVQDEWFSLTCKPEILDDTHPVRQLDAQILTDYILAPLLNITDLKTSDRIKFISGEEGVQTVIDEVNRHVNGVGFILSPITMDQVKAVADAHLIMPPKSTWVEPKLRSGLTIYPIDHD